MDTVFIIKIVSSLLYPLGLAVVFIVIALIARATKQLRVSRFATVVALGILVITSNPLFARWAVKSLEQQHPLVAASSLQKHDAILVLGGGIQVPSFPKERAQLGSGSDRYWLATQVYKQGKADSILLAGGNVYARKGVKGEAFYAAQTMVAWGIPSAVILTESGSRTTAQNFSQSMAIINQHKFKKIILVTSAYHMARAVQEFRIISKSKSTGEGSIEITPMPADILIRENSTPELLNWLPSVHALSLSTIAAHEYYGIWFSKLKALMRKG